jgi:hypothetical protein
LYSHLFENSINSQLIDLKYHRNRGVMVGMMKRLLIMMVVICVAVCFLATPVLASDISLVVNGHAVHSASPFMQDGRTLVPLRAIAEALDVYIMWIPDSNGIFYFNDEGVGHLLTLGSRTVELGGGAGVEPERITIDVAPVSRNGVTFVPVRFIAESFGISTAWNDSTRTVVVGDGFDVANMRFYDAFPSLPDFGAITGGRQIEFFPRLRYDYAGFVYMFDRNDVDFLRSMSGLYGFALENVGFVSVHSTPDGYFFASPDSQFDVAVVVGDGGVGIVLEWR